MGLSKYKLGELIELTDERNTTGKYLLDDVKGISTEKRFIDTKANMDGVSLDSYKVVNYREFAYVPDTSRRGDKIALAFNNDIQSLLISSIYTTFKCNRLDILIPEYLYIFFNRPEFDRYSRFNSWGSARETFSWEDFCDIDITLPSIEQQRKYVDVYLSLQNNLATYQSKVDDLKLVCDGYLDQLTESCEKKKIGAFITQSDSRNVDNKLGIERLRGISTDKVFIETKADMLDVSLSNYKLVASNEFAYVADTSRRGDKVALAFNDTEMPYIISSIYTVFKVKDVNVVDPNYLMMFFTRTEFDRYARFNSWGSARETFDWSEMNNVQIPIPTIEIQRSIASLYKEYNKRKAIAAQLKEQLNNLCPILIKGSLQN